MTLESQWDYTAENATSGAYGIPQSLPADKMASEGEDYRTIRNPRSGGAEVHPVHLWFTHRRAVVLARQQLVPTSAQGLEVPPWAGR